LDDSLPEVHNALAGLYFFDRWEPERADAEAVRAIALNPNYAEIHHLRAYILQALNRPDEALQEQKRATALDPWARPWAMGKVLTQLRQYDAAADEFRLRAEAQPQESYLPFLLSDVYRHKGMWREAAEQTQRGFLLQGDKESAGAVRRAYESGGEKALAEWLLNKTKARARKGYISPIELAFGTARLKRTDETLTLLEEAYRERSPWLVLVQNDPEFDFLHGEERYRAIVTKMHLPPAY
jgi:tetratricopeptide (TPR) repeat protein